MQSSNNLLYFCAGSVIAGLTGLLFAVISLISISRTFVLFNIASVKGALGFCGAYLSASFWRSPFLVCGSERIFMLPNRITVLYATEEAQVGCFTSTLVTSSTSKHTF